MLSRRNGKQQLGKMLLTVTGGRERDANLYDISPHGVGFNMSIRDVKKTLWEWRSTLDAPGTKICWDMVVILSLRYVDTESEQRQKIGLRTNRLPFFTNFLAHIRVMFVGRAFLVEEKSFPKINPKSAYPLRF